MSFKCAYHPEREASEKCEECGKLICLECKTVYHSSVHGGSEHAYSVRYEFCPVCFYNKKIKKYGPSTMIESAIFVIGPIIFVIYLQSYEFLPALMRLQIWLILGGIAVGFGIYGFIYSPIKLKEFKRKKEEFLNGLEPLIKEEVIQKNFCPECGTRNEPDASICSYCGATIKKRA